jgi:hypothetical protein
MAENPLDIALCDLVDLWSQSLSAN